MGLLPEQMAKYTTAFVQMLNHLIEMSMGQSSILLCFWVQFL